VTTYFGHKKSHPRGIKGDCHHFFGNYKWNKNGCNNSTRHNEKVVFTNRKNNVYIKVDKKKKLDSNQIFAKHYIIQSQTSFF